MKKLLCIILALFTVISLSGVTAFAANDVSVAVNGDRVSFDQPPVIRSGRTLVPARAVFETLGASVYWDETPDGGYVSVVYADKSVVLEVNRETPVDYMIIDNLRKVALDVPAGIIGGRTMVPLRAIGDALSCEVDWDGETRTASLKHTVPETSVLSEEINKVNSELTYKAAKEELQKNHKVEEVNAIPSYTNGIKYYEGISLSEEKKYTKSANGEITSVEYPIYATVNGDIITEDEYGYFLGMYTDASGNLVPDAKNLAKKDIDELAVSAAYAKNKGRKIDAEIVKTTDIYINSICYGLEMDVFASLSGVSKEVVYSIAEKQALRNALFFEAASNGEIDISENTLKQKFGEIFYKAKHILFKTIDEDMNEYPESEKQKIKKQAEEVLEKIRNGEDFDTLMAEYTEDSPSSLEGYVFTDGQMVTSFEDGVKALEADEVSDIIESEYGYHIIKRLFLSADAEKDTYEYYKNSLINYIASEYFNKETAKWAESMDIKVF